MRKAKFNRKKPLVKNAFALLTGFQSGRADSILPVKSLTCSFCGSKFGNKGARKIHILAKHPETMLFAPQHFRLEEKEARPIGDRDVICRIDKDHLEIPPEQKSIEPRAILSPSSANELKEKEQVHHKKSSSRAKISRQPRIFERHTSTKIFRTREAKIKLLRKYKEEGMHKPNVSTSLRMAWFQYRMIKMS